MFAELNLTDDQKAKIKDIRTASKTKADALRDNDAVTDNDKRTQLKAIMDDTRQQIEKVLTAEQLAKLQTQKLSGPGGLNERVLAQLKLTDDQKAKVKAIREQSQSDFRAILTTEQQAQLDKAQAARKEHTEKAPNEN